jgi:hypothetical protein
VVSKRRKRNPSGVEIFRVAGFEKGGNEMKRFDIHGVVISFPPP